MSGHGIHIAAVHVGSLRQYLARADELLAEAEAEPARTDELLQDRDAVLAELSGYVRALLEQAAPTGEQP